MSELSDFKTPAFAEQSVQGIDADLEEWAELREDAQKRLDQARAEDDLAAIKYGEAELRFIAAYENSLKNIRQRFIAATEAFKEITPELLRLEDSAEH